MNTIQFLTVKLVVGEALTVDGAPWRVHALHRFPSGHKRVVLARKRWFGMQTLRIDVPLMSER